MGGSSMSKIYEIKHSGESLTRSVPASHIVGKKVIASSGKKVGEIGAIHIHPRRMSVEGIVVKKGLLKRNFIGKDYIRSLNNEGAMLNIIPAPEMVGLQVYDVDGRKIGKVKRVNRESKTNNVTSIIVGRGVLKKDTVVRGSSIDEVGKNVTLKIRVDEQ